MEKIKLRQNQIDPHEEAAQAQRAFFETNQTSLYSEQVPGFCLLEALVRLGQNAMMTKESFRAQGSGQKGHPGH